MHQNEPISGHIISGRSILCDGSLHLCIPNSLSCIKTPLRLCTRFVAESILQPRTSPSPKTTAPSASIKGFCSCQPSVGVRFNFALFAPRVLPSTLLAAQYRSQSVILNTHRDTPANYRRLCLLDRDSKTQLQALI